MSVSCGTKKTFKKPSLIYASRAKLEKCIGKINYEENLINHRLKKGETIFRLSKIYGTTVDEIIALNQIYDINDIPVGKILLINRSLNIPKFAWPAKGQLTSRYGNRNGKFHHGIDIAARKGAKIRSAADGVVILSGSNIEGFRGYGKLIVLQHNEDTISLYAHNSSNHVYNGDCVRKGELIGKVGSTGRSTGSHLHFEVRKKNRSIDPYIYLEQE